MYNINTIMEDVEVLVPYSKLGSTVFNTYCDRKFSELKCGDVFRIKLHGDSTNYCCDMIGRENFICVSDAKYNELKKWSVEIE